MAARICPNCNAKNGPKFKYCGECGINLETQTFTRTGAEPPTPPAPATPPEPPPADPPAPPAPPTHPPAPEVPPKKKQGRYMYGN